MKLYTIASGSKGNASLLVNGNTRILIDFGISTKRLTDAIKTLRIVPEMLDGILITHVHSDHVGGLKTFVKKFNTPIYCTNRMAEYLDYNIDFIGKNIRVFEKEVPFFLGGMEICGFKTPHDTDDSVGYRIIGEKTLGYCTDCGCVTEDMLKYMVGVDLALIESNHDVDMLKNGIYPDHLKRRVLSDRGHLSNELCGKFAMKLYDSGVRNFILAHLSQENNTRSLAKSAVSWALKEGSGDGFSDVRLEIAPEKEILEFNLEVMSL